MGFLKTSYNKVRRGFMKGNSIAYNAANFLKTEIPRLQHEYHTLKQSVNDTARDIGPEASLFSSGLFKTLEGNPISQGLSAGLQEGKVMAGRFIDVENKVKHHSDMYARKRHQTALAFAGN